MTNFFTSAKRILGTIVIAGVSLLLMSNGSPHKRVLFLNNAKAVYHLEEYVSLLEDSSQILTLSDILTTRQNEFLPNTGKSINLGLSSSAFWIKLEIQNQSRHSEWILEIAYGLIDELDCFVITGGQCSYHGKSGMSLPYYARATTSKNPSFALNLPPNSTLYLRAQSRMQLNIPLSMLSPEVHNSRELKNDIIYLIYYVVVGLILILNIIYLLILKRQIFLLYILSTLSLTIGLATHNGLAYQYLWPDFPELNGYSNNFFAASALFFFIWFQRTLLLAENFAPVSNRLLKYIQIAIIPIGTVFPFFIDIGVTFQLNAILTITTLVFLLALGIRTWRSNYKPAKYYLIGLVLMLLGVAHFALSFNNVFHSSSGPLGVYIGSLTEMIFFMISMTVSFRMTQQREMEFENRLKMLAHEQNNSNISPILKITTVEPFRALSNRELEILEKISLGLTDKEIAEQLFISLSTVKTHARHIFSKLDVKNRTEATALIVKFYKAQLHSE